VLYNKTKRKKIVDRVKFAKSHFQKARGLMFEKKANFDYALVFLFGHETRMGASIHMLFVFFPITVIYLNSDKKVVDVAVVNSFALNYTPKKPAAFLVELPVAKAKGVNLGDKLEF